MIQKSILLRCGVAEAFELFTSRVSEWWPQSHRLTKDPESQLFMERGGRFWERARDGREKDLGHVVSWEPPRRLVLDFYLGTSAAQPTAVEVTFAPEGGCTRVTVNHRAKPESVEIWTQRAARFETSWNAVLEALGTR